MGIRNFDEGQVVIYGISWRTFTKDLQCEIKQDNVSNGAAALAYYLMLSVFPGMIALLSILPFLPIPDLDKAILGFIHQALPGETAGLLTDTVMGIVADKRGGLLTFGLLLAIWSASNGLYAVMQQLNITYDVKEGRPFYKARGVALLLTVIFGALVIGAFALIIFGGVAQDWLASRLGWGTVLTSLFTAVRWVIIFLALLLAFALTYYLGPDVEQKFRFITPGSVIAVMALTLAALGFRIYMANFANYNAVYGGIGGVIALLFWLYLAGWVILIGSEINALVEHYSPEGKVKGEKSESAPRRGTLHPHRTVNRRTETQAVESRGRRIATSLLGFVILAIAVWREHRREA